MERKKMEISNAYIIENDRYARVCVDAYYESRLNVFWYEVEKKYKDYLCFEKNDAFVTALLYYCMVHNMDIISHGDVSARLLYQINDIYIPALSNGVDEFNSICVFANPNSTTLKSAKKVGTAYSGGVDSLYTILKNQISKDDGMEISCLTYFRTGFGGNSLYGTDLNEKQIQRFGQVALDMGLPYVEVRTNIRYYTWFDPMVSMVTLAAALSIQKYLHFYLFSSTYKFSDFRFDFKNSAAYDLLTVQSFSTENLIFYSTGSEAERMEKLEYISEFQIAQDNIDVCWCDLGNCQKEYCGKCQRTYLELFAIGKLDLFRKAFNVDYFISKLDNELGIMLYRKETKPMLQEVYNRLVESGYNFSNESLGVLKRLESILKGRNYPEVRGIGSVHLNKLKRDLLESDDNEKLERIKLRTENLFTLTAKDVRISPRGFNMKWLCNEIERKSIRSVFDNRKWKKVAIYGSGKAARNLEKYLRREGITPSYVVCEHLEANLCSMDMRCIELDEKWEIIDILFVVRAEIKKISKDNKDMIRQKTMYIEDLIQLI